MAIPIMMRFAYSRDLIAGTICAGGSLGTMIPPSIVVVIYASVANLSVGKLFAAILLPGLLMVALFFLYLLGRALIWPSHAPAATEERIPLAEKLKLTLSGILPAAALIAAVLGAIIAGWATPTEAASVGAVGAVVLTMLYRRFSWAVLYDTLKRTLTINCMILLIVVGGNLFAGIFRLHGGNRLVQDLVGALPLPPEGVMVLLLGVVFVAGFILDWVSVVLITLPIFLPVLAALDTDPIWFAVLMIVVIQTSYLTPPMAPSIFYLRSIAPPQITYGDMYKGVAPFIICQLLVLAAVALFPALATYLPDQMKTF
jgi:tripartite ATP-independent transporter DctM subunit